MNEITIYKETQMMTSLEIAEVTGKQHKHLMEAIRKMEPAWVKVHGSKFRLMFREVTIGNGAVRQDPCLYAHQDRVPVHRH
jgi:phage regulator Rha-like protein